MRKYNLFSIIIKCLVEMHFILVVKHLIMKITRLNSVIKQNTPGKVQ